MTDQTPEPTGVEQTNPTTAPTPAPAASTDVTTTPSSTPAPAPVAPSPATGDPAPAPTPATDTSSSAPAAPPASSSTSPATSSGPKVGDLCTYTSEDAAGFETMTSAVVLEVFTEPDEDGKDVQLARVGVLPEERIVHADRLHTRS